MGGEVRAARRSAVEAARNKAGGFWCVHTDPAAATEAVEGVVSVTALAGMLACSDGAARAYDLLGTHTLEEFSAVALRGELRALSETIRDAENHQADDLRGQGVKIHDDITIVAQLLDVTWGPTSNVASPQTDGREQTQNSLPSGSRITT